MATNHRGACLLLVLAMLAVSSSSASAETIATFTRNPSNPILRGVRIGLHLSEQIRTLEWQHVSLLIIMILVAVALTDAIASRLRRSIAGRAGEKATAR